MQATSERAFMPCHRRSVSDAARRCSTRGVVDFHVRAELEERLEASRSSGRPLRVKAGFDPTRPDLHLGHAVLLQKMRQFQDLGHTAIFLVGDFTAMVGDPTGQNEQPPRLTREEVDRCRRDLPRRRPSRSSTGIDVEVRRNSEWLDKLSPTEIVELMAKTTVARMLERKDFAERFDEERAIHQHEFLYPLLQGTTRCASSATSSSAGPTSSSTCSSAATSWAGTASGRRS